MSRPSAWDLARRAHRRDLNDVATLRRIAPLIGDDFARRMMLRVADRLEILGERALDRAKREGRGQ
jgi:hypothetical protein